jgi:hypothetical protein
LNLSADTGVGVFELGAKLCQLQVENGGFLLTQCLSFGRSMWKDFLELSGFRGLLVCRQLDTERLSPNLDQLRALGKVSIAVVELEDHKPT